MDHPNKRTLYIDESGGHSLTDTRSDDFLLAGVVMENNKDAEISAYFEFLKRKHGIEGGQPFHSVDIFEARGSDLYFTPKKAKAMVLSLAEFIRIAPIEIKLFSLKKDDVKDALGVNHLLNKDQLAVKLRASGAMGGELRDIAYDILASDLFLWFSGHSLWRAGSRGGIIAESRKESDHALLNAFLQCKEPDNYRSNEKAIQKRAEKMSRSVTSIKFENKIGECAGLEIADLVSYTSFLALHRRLTFRPIGMAKIWREIQKKIHGETVEKVTDANLLKWLPKNRVHKISTFARTL